MVEVLVKAPEVIFAEAKKAAQVAYEAEKSKLRAMVVESSDGQRWYCAGGPCGFAWVLIRPARGKFVSWLKSQKLGGSAYGGGYDLWSHYCVDESRDAEFGQSMQLKEAACRAFAEVLRSYGLDAYAQSRMD